MNLIGDYTARLRANEKISEGVFHLTFECPEVARCAEPGNFVLAQALRSSAPLLRRPLGVLDADAREGTFEVLFRVVGQGTALLSGMPAGSSLSLRGPVGGSFAPAAKGKVWAVAGTLGVAPLLFLRRRLGRFDKFLLGVPNALWKDFAQWVIDRVPETELYSDDGSLGKKGFCIAGLEGQPLEDLSLVCCGPNPMMKALYSQYGAQCGNIQVSLEKRMGCGMGGCFGCVVDTKTGRRRVCVDGPVFQAREVEWNELHL